jgi:peptidoglycan/xylan/chitin deacetylase (PgdA/CDA1 family)
LSQEQSLSEMKCSREQIAQNLGQIVDVLAYPYGDHNPNIAQIALRAGYKLAVTTHFGRVRQDEMPTMLPRVYIRHPASGSLRNAVKRAYFWWNVRYKPDRRSRRALGAEKG